MTRWIKTVKEIPEKEYVRPFQLEPKLVLAHTVIEYHTLDCWKARRRYEKAKPEYDAAFPKHCRSCSAAGAVSCIENGAPHGAGFWAMEVYDGCEDCLGKGKCPLCGEDIDDEAEDHECGWNWDGMGFNMAPLQSECYCWEQMDHPTWGPAWQFEAEHAGRYEAGTVYAEYADLYEIEKEPCAVSP